jgi:osmotically-inducible protein OsmY
MEMNKESQDLVVRTHDIARGETCPTKHNDDLRRRVKLFLDNSNLPGLRHITINVDGGHVVLSGQVQTFYERQLAGEFSRRVAGVLQVSDQLEVRGYAPHVRRRDMASTS